MSFKDKSPKSRRKITNKNKQKEKINQKSEKNIHAFNLKYYQEITGNKYKRYQRQIQPLKEVNQELFHLPCAREGSKEAIRRCSAKKVFFKIS